MYGCRGVFFIAFSCPPKSQTKLQKLAASILTLIFILSRGRSLASVKNEGESKLLFTIYLHILFFFAAACDFEAGGGDSAYERGGDARRLA